MANNRFVWTGLDELRAELRNLPAHLADEASAIVVGAAEAAAAEIRASYPRRTGNLANHVKVSAVTLGQFGAGAVVKSTAKHAYLFEHGTQARHTSLGVHRGSMPPGNVFIPRVRRHRRAMYERLKALLQSEGLEVSGDA